MVVGGNFWKFVGAVHLVENDSASVSCSDIAKRTGAEYALLVGIMNHGQTYYSLTLTHGQRER